MATTSIRTREQRQAAGKALRDKCYRSGRFRRVLSRPGRSAVPTPPANPPGAVAARSPPQSAYRREHPSGLVAAPRHLPARGTGVRGVGIPFLKIWTRRSASSWPPAAHPSGEDHSRTAPAGRETLRGEGNRPSGRSSPLRRNRLLDDAVAQLGRPGACDSRIRLHRGAHPLGRRPRAPRRDVVHSARRRSFSSP